MNKIIKCVYINKLIRFYYKEKDGIGSIKGGNYHLLRGWYDIKNIVMAHQFMNKYGAKK